ncbi:MAG: hypothetical protein RR232_02410 [Clostridia bacterium]
MIRQPYSGTECQPKCPCCDTVPRDGGDCDKHNEENRCCTPRCDKCDDHNHNECHNRPRPDPKCTHCVNFCETLTLHESFDPSGISASSACIAYDTSFLGYTITEEMMDAELPCGGCCPIKVYKISLTGAIPYIMSVGSVKAACGCKVPLSVSGSTMVDEVIGYTCKDCDAELEGLKCSDIETCIDVKTQPCGCSEKTNITLHGTFKFKNVPNCLC